MSTAVSSAEVSNKTREKSHGEKKMEARLAEESRLCTYLPLSLKSFLGLFSPFSFATSHLTVLSFSGFIAELSLGNNCFSSRRATTAYDGEITFPSIEPTVFVTQVAKQHDMSWSCMVKWHFWALFDWKTGIGKSSSFPTNIPKMVLTWGRGTS